MIDRTVHATLEHDMAECGGQANVQYELAYWFILQSIPCGRLLAALRWQSNKHINPQSPQPFWQTPCPTTSCHDLRMHIVHTVPAPNLFGYAARCSGACSSSHFSIRAQYGNLPNDFLISRVCLRSLQRAHQEPRPNDLLEVSHLRLVGPVRYVLTSCTCLGVPWSVEVLTPEELRCAEP